MNRASTANLYEGKAKQVCVGLALQVTVRDNTRFPVTHLAPCLWVLPP